MIWRLFKKRFRILLTFIEKQLNHNIWQFKLSLTFWSFVVQFRRNRHPETRNCKYFCELNCKKMNDSHCKENIFSFSKNLWQWLSMIGHQSQTVSVIDLFLFQSKIKIYIILWLLLQAKPQSNFIHWRSYEREILLLLISTEFVKL